MTVTSVLAFAAGQRHTGIAGSVELSYMQWQLVQLDITVMLHHI